MVKKFLTAFLLMAFLVGSLALPTLTHAQEWWAPGFDEFNDKVNNPSVPTNEIFGERYTHAQVWWVIYSIMNFAIEHKVSECVSSNPDSLDDFITCATATNASTPDTASGGGLGFLEFARLSDSMVRARPASGVSYVASVVDQIGFPTAYAQQAGFGFNTLAPVLGLWAAARNAAYALMALAVVLLAFMVMFRARISPQVSVSVMSAIPRVIIGFLLITFSYAIAGFIIDLAYVFQGVIAAVVSQSGVTTRNPIEIFNMINDIGGGILNFGLAVVWIVFKSGFTSVFTVYLGFVASVLVLVIALILIVLAVIRIFWIFLRTYVLVILHVVALPFAALGYVASPSGNMFMQLLRSLVGHVSVFVSVSLVVMLAHILLFGMSGAVGGILSGAVIGNVYGVNTLGGSGLVSLPGFTGVDVATLGLFVGIVVLLMAPSIANSLKQLIISGRVTERPSLIGAGAAGFIVGAAGRAGMTEMGMFGQSLATKYSGATSTRGRILSFAGEQMRAAAYRNRAIEIKSPSKPVRRPGETT